MQRQLMRASRLVLFFSPGLCAWQPQQKFGVESAEGQGAQKKLGSYRQKDKERTSSGSPGEAIADTALDAAFFALSAAAFRLASIFFQQ